ncbi:hypothetical protein EVC45_41995 [Paraburkholderia sp. UYCP14C]|uniref:hypothetical protein n=1 Tax=Paraburkholderia sp. UYCP14C TaxID=2511130 RepID=UPI00101F6BA6|nr:hypothetical protein [Paraburkholderia sp. UYCP14C]RZF23842.1 hypothetical protein EVC45_41995 [Paraburkholderia sp. UYCP14C]
MLAKQAEYRARRRTDATPESVEPVESCSQSPALSAKEISVSESVLQYFELDVLPGVKHFTCDRYKATLSVESCADKFKQANSGDAFGRHAHCKRCPIGAAHGGSGPNLNLGTIKGSLTCSRCHRTNGRLIGKRLCTSCQNRQYESIKKRNAKGSAPIKLPPLHRLTIGYMAGGKVHMHTVERAVDTTELIVDVLRDSERSPSFGWLADSATRALRNNPDLDFSISSDDVDEVVPAAIAASVPASLDVVQADPAADVDADPYDVLRDAVEQLEHDAPVLMPTMSRRAGKKLRQQARKQVRVSNVTVNLLRGVGVLPAATPVVEPAPQPFFSPTLMSGGTAFG